jgi:DNA primase
LLESGLVGINEEGSVYDFLIDRITIPIYDNNGYLAGFSGRTIKKNAQQKYLNTPTTKIFAKGNILFNFFNVRQLDMSQIIIVEGYMDAIAY